MKESTKIKIEKINFKVITRIFILIIWTIKILKQPFKFLKKFLYFILTEIEARLEQQENKMRNRLLKKAGKYYGEEE